MGNLVNPYRHQAIAPSGSPGQGVVFDGTNDWLDRVGSLGGGASGVGTMSVWLRPNGLSGNEVIYWTGANHTRFHLSGGGDFILYGVDSAGNQSVRVQPAVGGLTNAAWNHIIISWDKNGINLCYVNDVKVTVFTVNTSNAAFNTDFNSANWSIGSRGPTNSHDLRYTGEMSDLYLTNEWVALDTAANRRKFSNTDGTPVDLGSDGSIPTGTAALLFMTGAASLWNAGTNSGSGGNFVMTGSVADSVNEPIVRV